MEVRDPQARELVVAGYAATLVISRRDSVESLPVADFRHVLALADDVLLVLNQLVADEPLELRGNIL